MMTLWGALKPFLAILGAGWLIYEVIKEIQSGFSRLKRKSEPTKVQYTAVEANFERNRRTTQAQLRIFIHNPFDYPIRLTVERMVTTLGYRNTDVIPAGEGTRILSPGTQKVRVQSGFIELPTMPSSGVMKGYLDWLLKCSKVDAGPEEFEWFTVRGDFHLRDLGRGYELQWAPFDDSEQMVDDEDMVLLKGRDGEITRVGRRR